MDEEIRYIDLETTVNATQYLEWRSPRLGTENPTILDSEVWAWIVRGKLDAWSVNEKFNGPSPFDDGPAWCFSRFGMSKTIMPDGRIIYIGGEHEDDYDPDFYIYNDVVVVHPDSSVAFYTYPKAVFPPTDFHTATLVGDTIFMIGSLGYPDERKLGETQVYALDTKNYSIRKIDTSGSAPGWIHNHKVILSSDRRQILLEKGLLLIHNQEEIAEIENVEEWQLSLDNFVWERLTNKEWSRWEVKRADNKYHHLWHIEQAIWSSKWRTEEEFKATIVELTKKLGAEPNLELLKDLYTPPVSHRKLPEVDFGEQEDEDVDYSDNESCTVRLYIEGVIVRYVDTRHSIRVTVEGSLSNSTIKALQNDLTEKLSALEKTVCVVEVIKPQ